MTRRKGYSTVLNRRGEMAESYVHGKVFRQIFKIADELI